MGVRFVIGRAGTGKTRLCADQIRREAARAALGGPLWWITPEQGTFTSERVLLTGTLLSPSTAAVPALAPPRGFGSFRAQVVSFRRLVLLMAREAGFLDSGDLPAAAASPDRPMDDLARAVLLDEIVRERRGSLRAFAAVADRPGSIARLDATLRELRQCGHSGDSIRALLETPPSHVLSSADADRATVAPPDALSRRKLHDLALLLDAWAAAVDQNSESAPAPNGIRSPGADFETLVHRVSLNAQLAPSVVGPSTPAPDDAAQIWVDGFSAMSALEVRLLVALATHASHATITLLADPASPVFREDRLTASDEEASLFGRTERLYLRLVDAFRHHRVPIDGVAFLRTEHRFVSPSLHRIERAFVAAAAEEATGDKPDDPRDTGDTDTSDVAIWECSDPETEVRMVAQAIRDSVLAPAIPAASAAIPLRFRDIGIIVPDLPAYEDALRRILTEHGIPHFIDQRRSIAHHPLIELLRAAVAIVRDRWDADDILLYLKTGLAGVTESDVATVENYILAHGITLTPWREPWTWLSPNLREEDLAGAAPPHLRAMLERVNAVRAKVWRDLQPFEHAAGDAAAPAAVYVRGLRDLLQRLDVESQLARWAAAARAEQASVTAETAQVHEQTWRQVASLLDTLESLLAQRRRSLEDFERLLATALGALTLGLIPPTLDSVLISSVTRSRTPELRAVFLLGAVEGAFPHVAREDPILSDLQRELINARTPDPVAPGSDRQLLDMPFFDYIALTRAGERLTLSYPLADRAGKALNRSRYIDWLIETLGPRRAALCQFDADSRLSLDRIATIDDLLAASVRHPTPSDPTWSALHHWLATTTDPAIAAARDLVWPARSLAGEDVTGESEPHLSPELARRFFPPERELRLSVSQLEKFAACPLQYFMHYTLGLRPRALLQLDTLNLGVLYHRILERIYRRIISGEIPWPNCDAATLRAALELQVDAAAEEIHAELALRTPGYDKLRARTKSVLGIMLEGDRRRACNGAMRPLGVEISFGGKETPPQPAPDATDRVITRLPVLRITTPAGASLELNGKIDRVDAAVAGSARGNVAVIDYKSSADRRLHLSDLYWGISLQLPVYAVVMARLAQRPPLAALYVPLGIRRGKTTDPADAATPEEDAFYQTSKPRGIIDENGAAALDPAVTPRLADGAAVKSPWFNIGYNKGGAIGVRYDMLHHDDFSLVLDYTTWKIAALADELTGGRIVPAPYRAAKVVPCDRCDFASLCPFDRAAGVYRDLPRMKTAEALAAMREQLTPPPAPHAGAAP